MFPSKGMDYLGGVPNLFPKTISDDSTYNYTRSPFQSGMVNRSSSSADSTSPESYLDNSLFNRRNPDPLPMRIRPDTPKHVYDTPKLSYESPSRVNQYGSFTNIFEPNLQNTFQSIEFTNSRQMFDTPTIHQNLPPIGGRKIVGRSLQMKLCTKSDEMFENSWQMDMSGQTPPEVQKTYSLFAPEQSLQTKLRTKSDEMFENSWQMDMSGQTPPEVQKTYGLFAPERSFQFSSPPKLTNESQIFNRSIKNISPRIDMTSSSPYTPRMPNSPNWSPTVRSNFTIPFQPQTNSSTGSNNDFGQPMMCTFCRKNGETPVVYLTHNVKEKRGNMFVVTCPILRSHVCSICNSSGDNAHTQSYCPILRKGNDGKPLKSTTVTLKNTRTKSNGRRRY